MLSLLLACVPHPSTPAALSAAEVQREAELREKCAKDANCMPLVAFLEAETPSPTRIREAVDLAVKDAPNNLTSAQVAVLVTEAHRDIATDAERATAWRQLCEVHAFDAACSMGADALATSAPDVAAALRDRACKSGRFPHRCVATGPQDTVPAAFLARVQKLGAHFELPAGFSVIPIPENPHFPADLAIQSADGTLEVRYLLSDVTDVIPKDPSCRGCVTDDGLRIQQSLPIVTVGNLTQATPETLAIAKMPPLAVRMEFNANWGITGSGLLAETGTPLMTLLSVHRDPAANLLILFIFHDLRGMGDPQAAAFHALRFEAPVGLGGSWL